MSLLPRPRGVKPSLAGRLAAMVLAAAPPGPGPVLAAVSGGGDSVALARLLAGLAPELGWRLCLAHVDHGLRPDSAADAAWVAALARSLDADFLLRRVRVRPQGRGPEEAARRARRAALVDMAVQAGATTIALAHSADDQAETLIMRAHCGSGPTGLAGMRAWDGPWWRPLLAARRADLRAHLTDLGQAWREDPSNAADSPLRNRVRALLPSLAEQINPRTVEALGRLAGLCAAEEDYWQAWCADFLAAHARPEGPSWRVDAAALTELHPAPARRVLRALAERLGGGAQGLLSLHIEQLLDLTLGAPGREACLPAGLWAGREAGALRLATSAGPPDFAYRLDGPGWLWLGHWPGWLRAEIAAGPPLKAARGPEAWLPLTAIRWPLMVRPPARGERFQALGAPGHKRLSRILMDRKLAPWQRRRTLLVADADGPWWAGPWCLHERARQNGDPGPWLRLVLVDTNTPPPYTIFFEISPLYPDRTAGEASGQRELGDDI
ncbi:MAG: tRNA lysidine(34) synthetase TilS [Pseudomonadota bacterium]